MSTRRRRAGDASKAVGYLRVSTTDQPGGLATQRMQVEKYAAAKGLQILSIHIDEGVSGATPIERRRGLLAALDALKAHGAGVLLAAKRDRFARDPEIMLTLSSHLRREGVALVTCDGVDASTPYGEAMEGMMDVMGRLERRLINLRVRAGMERKKDAGQRRGSVPYGYRLAEDGKTLILDEQEQETITRIVGLASMGSTQRQIAAWLESAGIPPRGRQWHHRTVGRILDRDKPVGSSQEAEDGPPGPSLQAG